MLNLINPQKVETDVKRNDYFYNLIFQKAFDNETEMEDNKSVSIRKSVNQEDQSDYFKEDQDIDEEGMRNIQDF
jgi:hypothetical protein